MSSLTLRAPLALLLSLSAYAWSGSATARGAADEPPQVVDGMQLKVHEGTRVVYVKPGATFGKYDRVMILDCGTRRAAAPAGDHRPRCYRS